jgi:hypothetical protein
MAARVPARSPPSPPSRRPARLRSMGAVFINAITTESTIRVTPIRELRRAAERESLMEQYRDFVSWQKRIWNYVLILREQIRRRDRRIEKLEAKLRRLESERRRR